MTAAAVWAPACMDADEYALWRLSNEVITRRQDKAARPCADCPLGHAADMRAVGRCNATPGGVEEDEPMEATVEPRLQRVEEPIITRRVEVAGDLPCTGCAHAVVCALRPVLEAVRAVQVQLPRLDAALTVQLGASVSCAHHQPVGKPARAERSQRSPAQIESSRRAAATMRERKAAKAALS